MGVGGLWCMAQVATQLLTELLTSTTHLVVRITTCSTVQPRGFSTGGSRPLRVPDQQLFTYMVIALTAVLLLLHPTSPSARLTKPAGPTGSEGSDCLPTSLLLSP
jgi:hypothetical protein